MLRRPERYSIPRCRDQGGHPRIVEIASVNDPDKVEEV